MMKRTILSTLCILAGIVLFLYPTVNDRYESYRQRAILKQWQENLQVIDQAPADAEPDFAAAPVALQTGSSPLPSVSPDVSATPAPSPAALKNVEGVLIIDKISLKVPILTDATVGNLKISVASIAHTGKAGAVGNYAIAGHRNFTYGKNFNRLDEVEPGDWIEVDTGAAHYKYQVQDKQYVLPEEVSVLEGNGKDREITLITCHPMDNPTHRIVVKGKIMEP